MHVKICSQRLELCREVLISAADDVNSRNSRGTLGRQCSDHMAESTSQVWDMNIGAPQWSGPGNDCRVSEVSLSESARDASQALAMELNVSAHPSQGFGESEAVFVDSFMNDRDTLCLCQRHNKGLLPVGHEPGMNICFQNQRLKCASLVEETDAIVMDVHTAADFTESVYER